MLTVFRTTLVLLAASLWLGGQVLAATPTQKLVLEKLQQLQESGVIAPGSVLRLQVKQGNRASFTGTRQALRREWEEATGVLLDIGLMPQGTVGNYLRKGTDADLLVARNHEYADLYHQELIISLDEPLQAMGLELNADEDFFLFEAQARFAGQTLAVPADGDLLLLYLRQDLLDDPQEKKAFRERFGYPLQAPKTWQQYQDQLEFFHRPDDQLYGTVELRDPALAWMHWLPRYASQAFPNQPLFDDNLKPLVNSPAGIAATQSYLATLPFSPEGIARPGSGYDLALPIFTQGEAYSLMITLAGAKLFNRPGQPITERYSVHPLPGKEHPQGLVRRTPLAFGNNLIIPASSPQPELALLYALWVTSAEISTATVSESGSFVDPFRYSHFQSPEIQAVYGQSALAAMQTSLDLAVPAGTGTPGDDGYLLALNQALDKAARGEITAEEAMQQVAEDWERITQKQGRASQRLYWQRHLKLYPEASERGVHE
ncbi:extracellular solute-binding protein [Marinospirillum sp.]|uniref:extracellular solute-binding protein n=1 Tax=Marinospirillum sp. TaxID=2183934 RepID=UPI00384D3B5C